MTAAELLSRGFSANTLVTAGYTEAELLEAGLDEKTVAAVVDARKEGSGSSGGGGGTAAGVSGVLLLLAAGSAVFYVRRGKQQRQDTEGAGGAQQARNPAGTIKFIAQNDALPLPRSPSGRWPAVLTVQADQKFLIPVEESPSVGSTEANHTNPSPCYLTPVTLNENYGGGNSNNGDYALPVADYEPAPGGGGGGGGGSGSVDGLYVDDGFYDAHGTENGSISTADAANANPTVVYAQYRSLSEDAGNIDEYDWPTADAANAKPTVVYAQYRSLSEDVGNNDEYDWPTADAANAKPTVVYAQYRSLSEDAGSNGDYDIGNARDDLNTDV